MLITTLGPLAVDGRPVRGDRLGTVIRELVGARGRTVSTGALAGALWPDARPDDTNGAVQALVGRVRRLGVPVLAAPGGYRIPAGEVQVDADAVRALADHGRRALIEGDAAGARGRADEARALFPEVPDLTETDQVRLFGEVVTLRAEAALAGGGPLDEADLRRLATRVPPDEPAAALLVRVLAAQGRDAEALDLVERVRAELAERYGADPSPVLTEAHVALLRGRLVAARPVRIGDLRVGRAARPAGTGDLPAGWRRAATPLVGRNADLAAVGEALREAPLVTVVAPGGTGKTRLAAEIARSAGRSRAVHVVELAGVRSPDKVRPAVLAALSGPDTAGLASLSGPDTAGRAALSGPDPGGPVRDRRVLDFGELSQVIGPGLDGLLVLDNCEHLLDAVAAVVSDLLAVASPGFGVLATSRAPLGLVGEVVHRLPALPDDEALALLEARVRAGGSAPAWRPEQALALCHRLDNLPLALELAAARLRHMPIGDVLAGLGDRFALLDDALRGLPERHAGLWAMVDWSRELLAPGEQRLLERLAVIPAPFTADLAHAVAGDHGVRRRLAVLVEQSLLALVNGRYRMLETVREYGEARLDAAGERGTAMTGLVGWGRERAVTLAAGFIGPGQIAALQGSAADQDNLVAALRWALDSGDEAAAVDVALALFQLWTVRGRHAEVSAWAGALLHLDDPAARRVSALVHDHGEACADRLAWVLVLIAINAGSSGGTRLIALARRALRTLLADRAGDVSPRIAALAGALPGLEQADPDRSLADAAALIAHPDAYVQGMGHFFRAVLTADAAVRPGAVGDAELAYLRFEAVGDHWGMGMAAHAAGHATGGGSRADSGGGFRADSGGGSRADSSGGFRADSDGGSRADSSGGFRGDSGGGSRADEWLRRSEQHLELVGAARDARSARVLLDTQLALAGDAEAELRLREVAGDIAADPWPHAEADRVPHAKADRRLFDLSGTSAASLGEEDEPYDHVDAGQAHLALAQLALRRGRHDEALAHADATMRAIADDPASPRAAFQIAVAVLRLWVTAARPSGEAAADTDARATDARVTDARVTDALRQARAEVLDAHDRPLLGAWAMAGAELAAYRGDVRTARELWSWGTRVGGNVSRFVPQGPGERLTAALGDRPDREPLLADAARLTGTVVYRRITASMNDLLASPA